MPPDQLEQIRHDILEALDWWAQHGLGGDINNLQITVLTYKKVGDQVYSRGQREPARKPMTKSATMLTFR